MCAFHSRVRVVLTCTPPCVHAYSIHPYSIRPFIRSSHRGPRDRRGGADTIVIREYPCRDYKPKPYRARASSRAQWGGRSRPEHRYSRLHGRSLRKSTRFCPNGFPFRCEKWRMRAAVSAATHFCASDHACDFPRNSRARPGPVSRTTIILEFPVSTRFTFTYMYIYFFIFIFVPSIMFKASIYTSRFIF